MAGVVESRLAVVVGLLLLIISMRVSASKQQSGVFNVKSYGASGDGQTDSTKAFADAWKEACAVAGRPKILIPKGNYLIGPLVFKGPCRGRIAVQLVGQLLASVDLSIYRGYWIHFQYIDGLTIYGGGVFNGQGVSAWPHNRCPKDWKCKTLPNSLVFSFVTDTLISGITSLDSKFFHIHVYKAKDIQFKGIKISAPGDSPNTDGIHLGDSTNVAITNSVIGTGDDCVSIGPGNENVTVENVRCGPGHGISIGSLGKISGEKDVVGVTVRHCTLTNTTNGLRIKTWQSAASSLTAMGFVFDDIVMKNVYNPIIIDQEYCPFSSCAGNGLRPSTVKIKDVKFTNIRGSSSCEEAIKFVCSRALPCEGVELSNIDLVYSGEKVDVSLNSTCLNVHGKSTGNVNPAPCI